MAQITLNILLIDTSVISLFILLARPNISTSSMEKFLGALGVPRELYSQSIIE